MELFLADSIEANHILFSEEESHHCLKVMRHGLDDELMVTDGNGKLFRAKISKIEKRIVELEILELKKEEPEALPNIHVAIAPTKNIDRFEWFLEKAAEIGIHEITPIICQRSERDKIKADRLQKILAAAMKQSLRLWLPKLNEIARLRDVINIDSKPAQRDPFIGSVIKEYSGARFIAHCQQQNLPLLKNVIQPGENISILIGPEGDFTQEEVKQAEQNGFISVSLGEARLRTETAGLVALHIAKVLLGP